MPLCTNEYDCTMSDGVRTIKKSGGSGFFITHDDKSIHMSATIEWTSKGYCDGPIYIDIPLHASPNAEGTEMSVIIQDTNGTRYANIIGRITTGLNAMKLVYKGTDLWQEDEDSLFFSHIGDEGRIMICGTYD